MVIGGVRCQCADQAAFACVGLRCEVLSAEKMQATLWRKLIVNAAINPIASLLDGPNKVRSSSSCVCSFTCYNGALPSDTSRLTVRMRIPCPAKSVGACEWSRHCVSMVVGEAFAVAQSEHVPLDCTQEVAMRIASRSRVHASFNSLTACASLSNSP